MATGAKAVERIAEATGILPATVSRAARTLREANPDLWPEAGKGGGKKAAHVEPRHLVNLVLALAAADPITDAPGTVRVYRSLTPQSFRDSTLFENRLFNSTTLSSTELEIDRNTTDARRSVTWLVGDTLGEAMEWLVKSLAGTPINALLEVTNPGHLSAERLMGMLQDAGFHVDLTMGQVPRAVVRGHAPLTDASVRMRTDIYSPAPNANIPPGSNAAESLSLSAPAVEAPLERITTIRLNLFKVLGELWADTLDHQPNARMNPSLLDDAAPAADQENENAGTSPEDPAPTRSQNRANGSGTVASNRGKSPGTQVQQNKGRSWRPTLQV